MTTALGGQRACVHLPRQWPAPLHPDELARVDAPTPYLLCDLDTIADRYDHLMQSLPGVRPYYAMKCNPTTEILRTLAGRGSGFEVASIGELRALEAIGVDPADVLYSNPIKPPAHIAAAHAAGLWRFSFDSEGELRKLAEHAPGSAVYIRLRVDDSSSVFPLSRKFGAEAHEARELLLLAERLGLVPYGITFHVGSPARYTEPVPALGQIADAIMPALAELLPYRPKVVACEPGRHLVAESAVMVASVLGRELRAGENWLYLDVGAYNGLMETQQTPGQWRFPLWTSRSDHAQVPQLPFTVTGPSCDSSDTMFYGVALPSTIDVGDRVYIGSAGAYTLSYASAFNGFPPPAPLFTGGG